MQVRILSGVRDHSTLEGGAQWWATSLENWARVVSTTLEFEADATFENEATGRGV
jgi:hypothetical protein